MATSRKDYVAIAAIIKDHQFAADVCVPSVSTTVDSLARALADHFGNENPRFDRGRFLDACKVALIK